ncbi:hypothetical protein V6N13_062185 [Hibiscus sabdariffa]
MRGGELVDRFDSLGLIGPTAGAAVAVASILASRVSSFERWRMKGKVKKKMGVFKLQHKPTCRLIKMARLHLVLPLAATTKALSTSL